MLSIYSRTAVLEMFSSLLLTPDKGYNNSELRKAESAGFKLWNFVHVPVFSLTLTVIKQQASSHILWSFQKECKFVT